MADPDAAAHDLPGTQQRLSDEIHTPTPGTALLRLQTQRSREGILDGAWWPRSRSIGVELPALVRALTRYLGPITEVGLDTAAWEELPTRLVIDERVVHIKSYPVGDSTILVTRGERDHFSMMVVPPDTTPEAARSAMDQSVRPDNVKEARQILIDTGADQEDRG